MGRDGEGYGWSACGTLQLSSFALYFNIIILTTSLSRVSPRYFFRPYTQFQVLLLPPLLSLSLSVFLLWVLVAPGWEMEFGMGGMGSSASAYASTAPMSESPAFLYGLPSADTLRIDDLLDFSSPDNNFFGSSSSASSVAEPHKHVLPETKLFANQADFSSNHDSYSPASSSFADDLFIPSEEAAELEWLSRFVDDSFSDMPSVYQVAPPVSEQQHFHTDTSTAPGRGARSKRSRGSNGGLAAANWSVMPPPPSQSSPSTTSSSSSSDFPTIKLKADNGGNSRNSDQCDNNNNNNNGSKGKKGGEGEVRRCTHCASEKTPQWRTGPLGPKTLCNACGVRYKSGRLVPEYRPAASPTFVLTQHSNSHRKVLELRRQKELLLLRRDNAAGAGAAANAGARPELLYHDYEVC